MITMTPDMDLYREILFAVERKSADNENEKITLLISDLPEKYHSADPKFIVWHIWGAHTITKIESWGEYGTNEGAADLEGEFELRSTEPYHVGRLTENGKKYLDLWYFIVGLEKEKDDPKIWHSLKTHLHERTFSFEFYGRMFKKYSSACRNDSSSESG